jgi:hypothetical protein
VVKVFYPVGTFRVHPDLSAVVQDDAGGRDYRTQPGVLTPGTQPNHEPALTKRIKIVLVLPPVRDRCLSDIVFLWVAFSCRAFGEVGSSRSFFTPKPRTERIQHLVRFTSQTYSRRAGTRALPKLHPVDAELKVLIRRSKIVLEKCVGVTECWSSAPCRNSTAQRVGDAEGAA